MREYTIKDHLGDTLIAYCDNNDGMIATPSEILQENNYVADPASNEMSIGNAFGYGLDGV